MFSVLKLQPVSRTSQMTSQAKKIHQSGSCLPCISASVWSFIGSFLFIFMNTWQTVDNITSYQESGQYDINTTIIYLQKIENAAFVAAEVKVKVKMCSTFSLQCCFTIAQPMHTLPIGNNLLFSADV